MQYVDHLHGFSWGFDFLLVASNDNDDLLATASPEEYLNVLRSLIDEMLATHRDTGILLRSRRRRRTFQQLLDAQRYVLLRYFSAKPDMVMLGKLRRYLLDRYLMPRCEA